MQESAVRICIDFNFEVVGDVSIGAEAKLRFPPLPTAPGVYRFRLIGLPDSVSTYIGETDNLRRRSYHYRNPGPTQQTNIRMQLRIRNHLDRGGRVEFATATRATLMVGEESVPLDLSQKSHRLLLENAGLVSNPKGEAIENLLSRRTLT